VLRQAVASPAVANEKHLVFDCLDEIRRARSRGLPDVPVVVFSAKEH
jgi:hypothetical protein